MKVLFDFGTKIADLDKNNPDLIKIIEILQ